MFEEIKDLIRKYREKRTNYADIEAARLSDSHQPSRRNSNVIVVCNQKGGCGKTTTSINLSACLAKKGYRVLLIDLDPQAHASLGLGVEVDNLRWTIYDTLIHNVELDRVIMSTHVDNLFLAPANHLLSGAQLELANLVARESILRINLNKLLLYKHFDFCIIDTSPTLNLVTLNGLVAASGVLIPIQTHYYSLEGMKELFSTIDILRERLNSELFILGILPTLFDSRLKINNEILSEIREFFGNLVLKSTIHMSSKLLEATRYKKPVISFAPNSKGAQYYVSLADELDSILKVDRDAANAVIR